jgi:putative transposase
MRQEDDDRRGTHVVAALNVQLVFVTKDRRGVLTGEHLATPGGVFASVGADFGAELVELDGETTTSTCSSPSRRMSRSPGR